jgi:hypothetical protein
VARERQPRAVPGLDLGTGGDHQIGLVALRRRLALDAHPRTVEVVAEEVGDRQVAAAARRVEGDETAEQLFVGEMSFGGHGEKAQTGERGVR